MVSSRGTRLKIAIVPEHEGKFLVSSMFIIIRLEETQKISPLYVIRFLESPAGQYFFEVNQSGSIATVLTPNDIKSIELPLLKMEQQNEFIAALDAADDLIRKAQESREKQYFAAYQLAGFGSAIYKN